MYDEEEKSYACRDHTNFLSKKEKKMLELGHHELELVMKIVTYIGL